MGTENQQPSGGINDLNAKYGGTSLGTGPYADPQDRELIWDREERAPFGQAEVGQASGGWRGTPGGLGPVIKRESEAEKHLYSIDEDEVPELQRRLWAGGFYPPGTNPEEIVLGDRDPYTDKAWLNAIDRAAKFKGAGRDLTIWEVIDMSANIEGADARNKAAGAGGRQPLVVELANPEDVKYYAQKTAVSVLGRGLKPDELNRFVSSFQAAQTGAQTQAYAAGGVGGAGGTVVGAPSAAAAAETFARQAAPTEAGAHDAVKVFDVMSKLLSGKRGRS